MSAWTTRSGWQRAAATAATLLAVGVLAACGSDDDTAAEAGSFDLPDGWDLDSLPVPPGMEAEDSTASDDNPSFKIFDTDADAVIAFYRQALPDAGLQITTDGPVGDLQAIQATGPGLHVSVSGDDAMMSVSFSRASS